MFMPNNSTPPCTLITIKRGYYHLLWQYRSQQSFIFPRVITRIWSATVNSLLGLSLGENNMILGYSLIKSLTIATFICTVWVCEWTYGVTMQMRPLRQQYLNSLHWFYLFLDSSSTIKRKQPASKLSIWVTSWEVKYERHMRFRSPHDMESLLEASVMRCSWLRSALIARLRTVYLG